MHALLAGAQPFAQVAGELFASPQRQATEKTRLIEFGRYAAERRKRGGKGKPETFDFLSFTHICGTI